MEDLEFFSLNDAGQVAYTGRYQSGNSRLSAIWTGPADNPALLYSTGSEISGFPSNVRYGNTEFFRLANNGSLAHVVQLTGPTERRALVVTDESDNTIVVQAGNTLMGRSAEVEIAEVNSVSHGISATAFSTSTSRFESAQTLWYFKDGSYVAVMEPFDRTVDSAPQVANSCRVFNQRNASFGVTDSGDLVYDAEVRNYSTGPCVSGQAVIRYRDGAFTALVKEGDVVPGAPASTFSDVDLIQLTDNGTALIQANVESPTGGTRPDVRWSYWAYTPNGSARLIAMEGEEVQLGAAVKTLSHSGLSTRVVRLNDAVQAALRLDFGNENELALFGGSAHPGQPHPALAAPGASSLSYAIDREATLPAPFMDTEFFSTIGSPRLDAAGNLIFYGEVSSSVLNAVTTSAIWQIDLEGNLTEIVRTDDTVVINGVENALDTLVQSSRFDTSNSGNILINESGAMMFLASTTTRSGNSVIVYLSSPNQ